MSSPIGNQMISAPQGSGHKREDELSALVRKIITVVLLFLLLGGVASALAKPGEFDMCNPHCCSSLRARFGQGKGGMITVTEGEAFNLTTSLLGCGQLEGARNMTGALSNGPDKDFLLGILSEAYRKEGNLGEAKSCAQKILDQKLQKRVLNAIEKRCHNLDEEGVGSKVDVRDLSPRDVARLANNLVACGNPEGAEQIFSYTKQTLSIARLKLDAMRGHLSKGERDLTERYLSQLQEMHGDEEIKKLQNEAEVAYRLATLPKKEDLK